MVGLFHLFLPSLLSLLFFFWTFLPSAVGVELASLAGGRSGEMALLESLSAKRRGGPLAGTYSCPTSFLLLLLLTLPQLLPILFPFLRA